jgi:prepilin-type N-terminal cleavage/methylation domain-containing protein
MIKSSSGVTLIEMIVVVLIIGILGAVAYRTIDATSYQSRFDKTSKDMSEIVKSIVGNPELLSDGRRINFGYVGDMGCLPTNLSALLVSDGANWKGPYIARRFIEDTVSFKTDAWGAGYVYDQDRAVIYSTGGGKQGMTMKIADSITDLFDNQINGVITDIDGAPPVEYANRINIKLTFPRNGQLVDSTINPREDGYYQFNPVPIGYHRIIVSKEYGSQDSIVRWISVLPRSNIVADFRFASGFRNNLKYVEKSAVVYYEVGGTDSTKNNIGFRLFNSGPDITLDSMVVIDIGTGFGPLAYYEKVEWEDIPIWTYASVRAGIGDVIVFDTKPVITKNSTARFDIMGFKNSEISGSGDPVGMSSVRLAIKFSDGSIIDFTP